MSQILYTSTIIKEKGLMPDDNFKEVTGDLWEEMTVNQLYEQLSILQQRSYTAWSMGNQPLFDQIQVGIQRLEGIIQRESKDDFGVTVQ